MSPTVYFVFITCQFGIWLGWVEESEYNIWKTEKCALTLHDVRGYIFQPVPGSNDRMAVTIGPPYPGDTKQLEIALFPHSVEIIGEIRTEKGVKICTGSPTLYTRYTEALDKWRAALSNIHTPTPSDIANLSKMKNVTKFPGR